MKNTLAFMWGMLIIGSFFVVNKQIVSEIPVFVASELRLLIGALVLYGVLKVTQEKLVMPGRQDMRVIFFQAFIGVFLFSIFSLYGLQHTSAINSGIIMGATPIVIFLIAVCFASEPVTPKTMFAALIASVGVVVINTANTASGSSDFMGGDYLVILAMVCEAIFIISGRFIRGSISPVVSSALTAAIGALLFMPLAIYSAIDFEWASVTLKTWLCVAYSGVGITAIGVLLMNYGTSGLPMSTTASLSAFMPASGCVLAVLLLGESFTVAHLIGLVLIVAGALITSLRKITVAT